MTQAIKSKSKKPDKGYFFLTDQVAYEAIETKAGKKFYVTGYISVPEIDLYNDLITPKALASMLMQIKSSTIMLDYEHEAWRDNETIIPVGKLVEAKVDDRGLWVKAELNKASPKFKDMWDSIKGGFIKAFSIAFKPLKTVMKTIGDTKVRLIEDLQLLNVALTGNPVCQGAVMTNYGMKAVMLKAINDMEVSSMTDKEKKAEEPVEEAPEEPKEEAKEETTEEAKPEEPKEEAPAEEAKEEAPAEEAEAPAEEAEPEAKSELSEVLKAIKSLTEKVEAIEKAQKEMKSKSIFKSKMPEEPEAPEPKLKSVLDAI